MKLTVTALSAAMVMALCSGLNAADGPPASGASTNFLFESNEPVAPPALLAKPAAKEPSITCLTMMTSIADVDASMRTAVEVDSLEVAQRAMRVARADLLRTAISVNACKCRVAGEHFTDAAAWAKKSIEATDYRVFGRFYDESVDAYRLGAQAITTCQRDGTIPAKAMKKPVEKAAQKAAKPSK